MRTSREEISDPGSNARLQALASTYTQKLGDHGQNINRMPIWGIRTVVTKPPSCKYRGQSVFTEILLQTLIGT